MARQLSGRQFRDGTLVRDALDPAVLLKEVVRIGAADSPYTVLESDQVITLDSTFGAVEVLLPSAVACGGRLLSLKDTAGNAPVNNITLTPDGVETVDGVAGSVVLSSAFELIKLRATSSGWSVVGRR